MHGLSYSSGFNNQEIEENLQDLWSI